MTERTYNIIMACKSEIHCNVIDAVRKYMSKECGSPIECYTEYQMSRIMRTAMYDYLDSCDKPSIFLRYLDEWKDYYGDRSFGERIALAFRAVQVRDRDGNYVNGFGEWMK
jgi:hypothetical protein